MNESLTRRGALLQLVTLSGAVLATGGVRAEATKPAAKPAPPATKPAAAAKPAAAPALPHVAASDPTAIALAYTEDAAKVDAKKFPTYKSGQQCANCLQSKGAAGDAWLACNLFPGKQVNAKGWCKVYVKRP